MGFFEKLKNGLKKTKASMMSRIERLLHSFTKIDEDLFEELEETLIVSDIGVNTSVKICDRVRDYVKQKGITDPEMIKDVLKDVITEMLGEEEPLDLSTVPSVILVIGVNGVGKTTTIGKLAYQLHNEGKNVIVAAADTFRAAAIDQLEVWTDRAGVDLIKHNEGSDPAAVVYDALQAAKSRNADVLICDTAGRLHNKKNLMKELEKISRIVHQNAEGCALEVLLALDATTGQNAVNQAMLFNEAAPITGIILTKLDGTAKGGIVITITDDLKIPVKLITVGEGIDDIQPFIAKDFVDALFD
ncbi:MAG: signal recognition particle-docking protein FtsY [Ruminococcus sp.]|nr:signal recognition particle-docking protein FtsY [Ruminococcus sp.]